MAGSAARSGHFNSVALANGIAARRIDSSPRMNGTISERESSNNFSVGSIVRSARFHIASHVPVIQHNTEWHEQSQLRFLWANETE
mmetsp:Transcript_23937/g.45538  ORF Transcript_23937/g.45538 Transcript_23937/m.45538 type:complete len:86 (+) Transcript_23937:73-330(+)|eukprot:scaffold2276_cov160-Amphora_coffeaeformis.AAC.4